MFFSIPQGFSVGFQAVFSWDKSTYENRQSSVNNELMNVPSNAPMQFLGCQC